VLRNVEYGLEQRRGLRGAAVEAAARGEVSQAEVAMLEDRIRVLEGRPQPSQR